jgi:hypothetical protein
MNGFIENWSATPRLFAGELDVLNPMIELGVSHRAKYDALLRVVYEKRGLMAHTRRTDYQRDLMQALRRREQRAVQIAEWERGLRMTPDERAAFVQQVKREWETNRLAYVRRNASDPSETRQAIKDFWSGVEKALEDDLVEVMRRNPVAPSPAKRKLEVENV